MPKKTVAPATKKSSKKTAVKSKAKTPVVACSNDLGEIQEKAYYIWLDKGCPEDSDMDNWLEAERLSSN